MEKVKFNLNDCIKVKIKDEGIEHCVHNNNKIMPIRLHTSFKEFKKSADKEGYFTFQMHSFIDYFGGQGFRMGQLLDSNIYLLKKDIETELTNTQLIAAAPELLEALNKIAQFSDIGNDFAAVVKMKSIAVDAIKKAS